MIIGLGYKARAGKDTVGAYLAHRYGFKVLSFAAPLKEAAAAIYGFTHEQLYGDQKAVVDPFWGETPRRILEKLGTDAVRNVMGEDTWVRALERRMQGYEDVVITDVRFPNEGAIIKQWGGLTVEVRRPGAGAGTGHISDTAMQGYPWDVIMLNQGTLAELYAKCDYIVDTGWAAGFMARKGVIL